MTQKQERLKAIAQLIVSEVDGLSEADRMLIGAAGSEDQLRRVLEAIHGRFHAAGKSTQVIDQQLKELADE